MSSSNPLVFGSPPVAGDFSGTVLQNGDIKILWSTTLFPSSGIQVQLNGKVLAVNIVNDVSCVTNSAVHGIQGILTLTAGLGQQTNYGADTIATDERARFTRKLSPLCG
jgi:hypothetical protein